MSIIHIGDSRLGDHTQYDEEKARKIKEQAAKGDKPEVTFVRNPLQKDVKKQ